MKKIFEIPVYALDKKTLSVRVEKVKQSLQDSMSPYLLGKERQTYLEVNTYPQRIWDYNHIVGYISILIDHHDIIFNVHLPTSAIKRYYWHSKAKKFVYNIMANGTHFHISDYLTTEDIRLKTVEMLDDVIEKHIPNTYFVDREAFDTINLCLDYRGLLNGGTV